MKKTYFCALTYQGLINLLNRLWLSLVQVQLEQEFSKYKKQLHNLVHTHVTENEKISSLCNWDTESTLARTPRMNVGLQGRRRCFVLMCESFKKVSNHKVDKILQGGK